MNKPQTMSRLIEKLSNENDKNDKRTIILNISDYSKKDVQDYCKKLMLMNLIDKDFEYYKNNKEKFDKLDIDDELTLMVVNDYFLKDNIKAVKYQQKVLIQIVLSPEQYKHKIKIEDRSNLSFMQEKLFSITRGISVNSLEESTQLSETLEQLKQSGLRNKIIPVQFGLVQQVFFFNYEQSDQIRNNVNQLSKKLVQMVKGVQKLHIAPILDLKITQNFGNTTQIAPQYLPQWKNQLVNYFLQESKNLLQNTVYELQQAEVQLEKVIICTNIAECIATIKEVGSPYLSKLSTFQLGNEAEKIAFQTMKICNQTIPPAVAGVFQKLSFSGDLQRFDFALMIKLENQLQTLTSWGTGTVVDTGFIDEAVMAFSILSRHSSAHSYLHTSLENLKKAILGKFEDQRVPQKVFQK